MADTRWCCTVCGYIHEGNTPPDCCPVCGATPDLFEPSAPAPAPVRTAPRRWRCINCDYVHDCDTPPECCPVCGVGPDQFEPVVEEERGSFAGRMSGAIVIIGGGIAGLSAAEAARSAAPNADITIICQENDLPYYRLNLTRYLAGEITISDLPVHPEAWYAEQRITILNGAEVTAVDRAAKTVSLKRHDSMHYDKLILAMGAHPSIPPIPGADRNNVVTLRTCRDAETILQQSQANSSCVIIGGGVLGLEAAAALARRKVQVTLVEGFDWLLPRQLNKAAGERLAEEAIALGITLICGARIKELKGDAHVRSVVLESGESIPADLVLVAAGVRSNSYLARMAGLDVNCGVVVDQHLRTSDPDIYAAGDLAEHLGTVYGTWAPSQFQGTIAGMNAAGGDALFAGIPRSNSIKVLGVDLFSIGMVHPDDASYLTFEEEGAHYQQFIFRDSLLVGAILFGDTSIAPALKKLIEKNDSCAELLAGAGDARDIRAGILAMT
ncbi:FAD-dependent oxidoreductase [Geobacter pelophilus]|uniref:FAD-dependent oxidoreductase n=1 Tax=Geoanaerobacter pelophilus TaxID=60036 RepID=A0AAW4KY94_9BACT|nr:FAD-dependent oxidoreductase [Geoanaerobacter pelophilus]MBT0663603.1 FAD-dependent oxidoreductase [Geoanaerobacter pelophilus]